MGILPNMTSHATFQASDVLALTGLSPSQLREWSSRRGIMPADQPARGRGKHAQYAWNTVLVLRILVELKREFRMEIAAWSELGIRLRDSLAGTSPTALYGRCLLVRGIAFEIAAAPWRMPNSPTIAIPLDAHLEVLAGELGLVPPSGKHAVAPA
jgi:hypothetical protein